MKITLLTDLQPHEKLISEFGLSLLLEKGDDSWLFDTGAGAALAANLDILHVPPEKYLQVILSHGHYDHSGGLAELAPQTIYCCRGVDQKHFSFHSANDIHDISMPFAALKVLYSSQVKYIDSFTGIADGVWLTGPIPRKSFEDCGGRFFSDSACRQEDIVAEEQALLTAEGILISGCCHAGLINTMEYCRKMMPDIKIRTVIGGLHLRNAARERLEKSAEYLRNSAVEQLWLMHCTGTAAIEALHKMLPEIEIYTPALGECREC